MPCSDGGGYEYHKKCNHHELDKYVDMLCRTLKKVELMSHLSLLDKDIQEWWFYHKEWDKKNGR